MNLIQKANELLFSLNTNNVNLIRQALDFFESFAEDPNVLPLTVWPPFLMFICSETHPSELIKRGEALCIRFAKIYEILCDISQVADLFQFVKPNTLEIFLYVIHFLPNVIDNSIVKRLFTLLEDESCSKKAIILIIKIVQNSPNPTITKSILDKFKQDALQYSDTIGGDLILQTLVFYNFIQNDVISAYGQSKVPENVIAAYQALYTIKGQPELFSLSNVLLHITSSNEKLRNEALEFIRRYASGAVNEPLLRIIFSLFESAIKYESEKAALLLIRIASDPKRCIYVFKVGVVDSWLQAKPKVAVNLLKLYIASINSDERAKTFLSQHQLAGTYFANVLRANDENAAVACCWTLVQSKITPSLANSLMHSEFVSLLCDFMMNENTDPLKYVHFLNALAMISPHVYHSKFNEVLQVIMNMVNNKVFISYYCIITLATLSEHPETHSTLVSANIFAVLSRYNDNGESKKYQQKLFSNLKKSGFLNFA
ncbi:hypothetical protein TRFO_35113 [Tritrichomonas foetus]|uniref:Clathrin/coatomer adaptor adaptin-like N-terminal domain-containing protein n=1 Tax=Tritrichomonas foetus TaxID=1144522 RepID=A0A1J4JLK9_9EUKA|nr:hypothetical protein TRFO_35113 [Tritrichomonas foetus]|eukprot:OHS98451.1 hypothetical protein TRFO_35113 [Tritrichomonas foetus]